MMEAKPVLFHSKGHPFSNFYPIKFVDTIVIQGDKEMITFGSVEHYLQACKAVLFQDFDKFHAIVKSATPLDAKDWGNQVAGFDDDRWCAYAKDIVIRGCWCKFEQNPELRAELCQSGRQRLGECSMDTRWGIGMGRRNPRRYESHRWTGLNWQGECLEVVRGHLRTETTPMSFDVSLDNMTAMEYYDLSCAIHLP